MDLRNNSIRRENDTVQEIQFTDDSKLISTYMLYNAIKCDDLSVLGVENSWEDDTQIIAFLSGLVDKLHA